MSIVLFPFLLLGGLLMPGWLLGRALGTQAGIVGATLGSVALLTNLVLVLDSLNVPLDRPRLGVALALLGALLVLAARLRKRTGGTTQLRPEQRRFRWRRHHWLLAPGALALGAIMVRATVEPLNGFDTIFRWDFLARQMLEQGTLRFYPAVTAEDFISYGWCDGIPPLVSILYFWTYLCLGRAAPWATVPIVVGVALVLFQLVYRLAVRSAGATAGCFAIAIVGTSSALLWGVAMGQETGFTALALVALLLFIAQRDDEPNAHWLIWAGMAAGVGALTREYGLVFVLLGGVALAWRRVEFRGWMEYLLAATAVALPWYLRTWVKTGNPLYSHELGGLFPVNLVHVEYMRAVSEMKGLSNDSFSWLELAMLFALLVGLPLLLGIGGGVARWRVHGPWVIAIFAIMGLWLVSLSQTSGGFVYSLRVLTPALALSAILGGAWIARGTHRLKRAAALLLAVAAIDSAVRSLSLPIDPRVAWWRQSPMAWHDWAKLRTAWENHSNWRAIVDAAEWRKIVVSDPACHAILTRHGGSAVPLFSPAVRFLFDAETGGSATLARLRDAGVRFVLVTRKNPISDLHLDRHSFFRALKRTKPAVSAPLYFVYDLFSPELANGFSVRPPT